MDPRLLAALDAHIGVELGNSLAYLSAYAWCRANGWEGFSKRWKNSSKEEHDHAQNFVKYCARRNDVAKIAPDVIAAAEEMSVIGLSRYAYALEDQTEQSMIKLVKMAEEVGDPDAVEYVSGKLVEQTKDSKKARDFMAYVEGMADDLAVLKLFDRKLENNKY